MVAVITTRGADVFVVTSRRSVLELHQAGDLEEVTNVPLNDANCIPEGAYTISGDTDPFRDILEVVEYRPKVSYLLTGE